MILNRDDILKAALKTRRVSLENGDVLIKALPASAVFSMREATDGKAPSEDALYKLVALSICDERGNAILSIEDVANLDLVTINTVIAEIYSLNGLNPEAVEKAKAELKKIQAKGRSTK